MVCNNGDDDHVTIKKSTLSTLEVDNDKMWMLIKNVKFLIIQRVSANDLDLFYLYFSHYLGLKKIKLRRVNNHHEA